MKRKFLMALILCQVLNIIYPMKGVCASENSYSQFSLYNKNKMVYWQDLIKKPNNLLIFDTKTEETEKTDSNVDIVFDTKSKKIEDIVNNTDELIFEVTEDKKTMYATTSVNIRTLPSKDSEKLGALQFGQAIEKLGNCDNGWSQVNYNGEIAYINTSYLQDNIPEKQETVSTYNGIIEKDGNVSDSRLQKIESYYIMIPQNVRTNLENSGWRFICSDNNFGAPYGYTGSILALSVYNEKIIYIDNRQKAEDAIIHEVGHAIDWISGFSSYQNDFLNIFNAEVETFRSVHSTHSANTSSPMEYFAEAYFVSVINPTLMQENCPLTYEFVMAKSNSLE